MTGWMAVAALALMLAGCSGGLGGLVTKAPDTAYQLNAATGFPRYVARGRSQLVIAEPTALGPLDGNSILVRSSPGQIARLSDAQWEDRLPKLVQARLVQSFENANRLQVGRPADKIASDFALLTDLRVFEVSAIDGTAEVEIAAKIVDESTNRIVAVRVLRATVPASAVEGSGAVAAINEAFAKVASQIVLWASRVAGRPETQS